MSELFDPTRRLVVIPVFLTGPAGRHEFRFAVDTGATRTSITSTALSTIGYTHPTTGPVYRVHTGNGTTTTRLVPVAEIRALGQVRSNHPVLWLSLPPAVTIDGLLGLDYFRGQRLSLDFARGRIALGSAKSWWHFWK